MKPGLGVRLNTLMCCIELHTHGSAYMHQVSFQPPRVLEDNDYIIIMHGNDCHAGQVSAATVLQSVMS